MGNVSIIDYLTLARAGYKKADIDQIIAHSQEDEKEPEEQPAATVSPIEIKTESAEPIEAPEKEDSSAEPVKNEIDYKSLYEKSQEDLKTAQAANRGKDSSENMPDPQKELSDIFRSYL